MKAMIWKELRESAHWVGMAVAGFLLLIAMMIPMQPPVMGHGHDAGLLEVFLGWPVVLGPLFGAGIGIMQTVRELRRDHWAFLVHRPATRTSLFFGKVAAGLLMYFAAVGVPFVAIVAWIAVPGHIAVPFMVELALPGVADILLGVVFYFAAILTCVRSARWLGSRLAGFAAALFCAGVSVAASEFWQALLVIVLFGAPMMAAAHGGFTARGSYRSQGRLARAGLAAMLCTGICAVEWIGGAFVVSQTAGPMAQRVSRRYDVMWNGVVMVVANEESGIPTRTTLDGKPFDFRASIERRVSLGFKTLTGNEVARNSDYRVRSHYFDWSTGPDGLWYFVYRTGRLVGYSERTGRLIGSYGPDGFSRTTTGPGFTAMMRGSTLAGSSFVLRTRDTVYSVDFSQRRVMPLMTVNLSQRLRGASILSRSGYGVDIAAFCVLTEDLIAVFDRSGNRILTTPVPFDPSLYRSVDVAWDPPTDHYFFWFRPDGTVQPHPEYLVETDAHGKELSRQTLPPIGSSIVAARPSTWTAALVPPIITAALAGYTTARRGVHLGPIVEHLAYPLHLGLPSAQFWTLSGASAAACALLAYLIGLRRGWSWRGRILWTVGVFALGLPGLLTLLAIDSWPAREPCPACGKKRVVDRETCEHCGAAWRTRKRDGSEIFEVEAAA
jgi:hypothetical protein